MHPHPVIIFATILRAQKFKEFFNLAFYVLKLVRVLGWSQLQY